MMRIRSAPQPVTANLATFVEQPIPASQRGIKRCAGEMAPIGGMTETTNSTGMMLSIMPKMVRLVTFPTRSGRPPPTAPAPTPASATTPTRFRPKSVSRVGDIGL